MKKTLIIFILLITFNHANECSPYFNPEKFYETPEVLAEMLDENFPNGIFTDDLFKSSIIKENQVIKKILL